MGLNYIQLFSHIPIHNRDLLWLLIAEELPLKAHVFSSLRAEASGLIKSIKDFYSTGLDVCVCDCGATVNVSAATWLFSIC